MSVSSELSDSVIPMRRHGYHLGRIPCCVVLQDSKDNNVLVLNDTGALIWRLCNGDINVAEMIAMITESFPESQLQIAADVYRTLDTFRLYELVDFEER